ncbi:MAG: TonB-dependent siderophore receptor [Burkholderiaceae bacterium]|jgi:iron complex outermembrane receptor protein
MALFKPFFAKKRTIPSMEWPLAAIALIAFQASAQTDTAGAPTRPDASLASVTVSDRAGAVIADVTGFPDIPLARSPFSATVVDSATIDEIGAQRLSDLFRLDSSLSDAYNAVGYWDFVTIRGFVVDQTYNYRRDGLPISGETFIPLENKERVEFLKGTSGILAGTSSPGGLVNYVVKRPTEASLRGLRLETSNYGGLLAHLELGDRFGEDRRFGYRLNAVAADVHSYVPDANGKRGLFALAMDWRATRDTLVEAEFELSRLKQPSVPGLSLLGNALPPANPFININSQPWSQPNQFDSFSGSIGIQQSINSQWRWQGQLGTQQLKTDDRLAYPFGCYDNSSGVYYADRFCPNGDFDLYDYRSNNERRKTQSALLRVIGDVQTGSVRHNLNFGVLGTRYRETGEPQADNNAAVGTGNIFTLPALPEAPIFQDPYITRTERGVEFFAFDAIQWTESFQTWLGLRHSRLRRESAATDGSQSTGYDRLINTPWIAATWQFNPQTMAYASYGEGVESVVAPGRSRYTNAGQPLPALKSRQTEVGIKSAGDTVRWNVTWFNVVRPLWGDSGSCDLPGTCTRVEDGSVRNQGIELGAGYSSGPWRLGASATWLQAQRQDSLLNPNLNGRRPTNVPDLIVRANGVYRVAGVPGLSLLGTVSYEGGRAVLPDESIQLPAWTRVDLGLSYETRLMGQPNTWSLTVDNVANRRYLKESPYQYGHVYLFPGAPRLVRLAVQTAF